MNADKNEDVSGQASMAKIETMRYVLKIKTVVCFKDRDPGIFYKDRDRGMF